MTTVTWNSPTAGALYPAYTTFNQYTFNATASPASDITYTVYSGALPPTFTLINYNGYMEGYPTDSMVGNTYAFTIAATSADNVTAYRSFSITILQSSITWNSPTRGNQGTFTGGTMYSMVPSVSTLPDVLYNNVNWQLDGDSTLPEGTTFNSYYGEVVGLLKNQNSSYSYTIYGTMINSNTSITASFSGNIVANASIANTVITWTSPESLPNATLGSFYSYTPTFTVANAVGTLTSDTFSGATSNTGVIQENMPVGWSGNVNALGSLIGTLYQAGTFQFTIRGINNGIYSDRVFTLKVLNSNSTVVTWLNPGLSRLGNVYVNTLYTLTPSISVANAVGLTTYELYGTLPAGTTLNPTTGVVSGTLSNSSVSLNYSFSIAAINNNTRSTRSFNQIVLKALPATTVTWNSPAAGAQANVYGGSSYTFTPSTTVTNPVGSTTYSLLSGTIPTGTTFTTSTGVISGTLTNVANSFAFTIRATNNGINSDRAFTQTVLASSNTWNSPTQGNQGTFNGGTTYSLVPNYTLVPAGQSIMWALATGTLPAGTTLNSTNGTVIGTLTNANSTYSYTIVAGTAAGPFIASFSGTIVATATTTIVWNSPAAGTQPNVTGNASYTFTPNVTVTNPVGSTTYSLLTGTIPSGTTFSTINGVISGTLANTAASYSFTIRATNNSINSDRAFIQNVVTAAPPVATSVTWVSPAAGALGTERGGTNYYFVPTVTVINPSGLTVYSITTGAIPSGTIFDPKTGIISGTLSNVTTSYAFTMRASVNGTNADRAFSGNVTAA